MFQVSIPPPSRCIALSNPCERHTCDSAITATTINRQSPVNLPLLIGRSAEIGDMSSLVTSYDRSNVIDGGCNGPAGKAKNYHNASVHESVGCVGVVSSHDSFGLASPDPRSFPRMAVRQSGLRHTDGGGASLTAARRVLTDVWRGPRDAFYPIARRYALALVAFRRAGG